MSDDQRDFEMSKFGPLFEGVDYYTAKDAYKNDVGYFDTPEWIKNMNYGTENAALKAEISQLKAKVKDLEEEILELEDEIDDLTK